MPRTAITPDVITRDTGGAVTMVAFDKANGMEYDNINQKGVITLTNTDTNPKTLVFSSDKTFDKSAVALVPKEFTVPASTPIFEVPALPNNYYSQLGTTLVYIDLDAADTITGLTIGVAETEDV